MQSTAATPDEYVAQLPAERKDIISRLRKVIRARIPKGFEEVMNYGMLGYVVPHRLYPAGYHCDPKLPLPFMNVASQKNHVSVYHMGLYADGELTEWFQAEYPKNTPAKLDMGKCCIRFKKPEHVPVDLIGELASKWTPGKWIQVYEEVTRDSRKRSP